jgi:hypothetical protein
MKNLLVWGGIFLALVFAVSLFGSRGDVGATQMQYSDFRAKVAEDVPMPPSASSASPAISRMASLHHRPGAQRCDAAAPVSSTM